MGLTLTPIKTSLISYFSGLKEVGEEEKCEFMYDTVVFLVTQPCMKWGKSFMGHFASEGLSLHV